MPVEVPVNVVPEITSKKAFNALAFAWIIIEMHVSERQSDFLPMSIRYLTNLCLTSLVLRYTHVVSAHSPLLLS